MKIELLIKKLFYSLFRIIFRNKNINVPLNNKDITNILILRYDAIGDMIVTLPVIRMLKQILPESNIDVIASTRNISIIEPEQYIRNRIVQQKGFFRSLAQASGLKKNKYDLVLSLVLNDTTKAGLIANLAGSKKTVKAVIAHDTRRDIYSALFNIQIDLNDYRNKITMLELQCKFVARIFGLESYEHLIVNKMSISSEDAKFAEKKVSQLIPFIVYNISSGNDYRTFTTEKNIETLSRILSELISYNVVIISAPNEQTKALAIKDGLGSERVFVFETMSLTQVSAIINKSDFVFTPDTSIVHIASAMQIPVFLIYSLLSSHVTEWLPYKSRFTYVRTKTKEPIGNIETDEIVNGFIDFVKEEQ